MKRSCILLLVIVSLSGCGRAPAEPAGNPSTTLPTEAHNLQTEVTNPTTPATEPAETAGTTVPPEETAPETVNGSIEITLTNWDTDEDGTYLTYTGGEMEVPILLSTIGTIRQKEIGILLFVDGQPQPYRTSQSQEYAYMHTFRTVKPGFNQATVWFIPVTGTVGEAPEVYAEPLLDPHRTLATNSWPSLGLTAGCMFRLKYSEAPPAAVFPEKQLWLTQQTVSYADTIYREIGTWSEEERLTEHAYHLYLNGKRGDTDTAVYDVSESDDITLRFELWGSPYVHYSVVFFVDHQPVFPDNGLPAYVGVRTGQKTVVEATLSLADFDSECLVYAVLVPRNYAAAKNHCFLACTNIFFLTDQENPNGKPL